MAGFVTVARAEEIGEGEVTAFAVGDDEVAIARVNGDLFAFSDICTHRACNLSSGGEIDGTSIECECHGSVFSMETGEVLNPPATEPLGTFEVREQDGEVQVAVPE
jgi:3-phenylpropionate/trans-cinnamate dioxygenase ferredoxin component